MLEIKPFLKMKKEFNESRNTCHVTFTLNHEANSVAILGDFSEWNPISLANLGNNTFEVILEIPVGRDYHFRYLINNNYWENDHAADAYDISPMYGHIENSILSLVGYSSTKKAVPTKRVPIPQKVETPKKVVASVKNVADDLTKIEGIGPKIAGLLKVDGIETFEKLSKSKVTAIQAILDKAGKRYAVHNPATWADQAKLAAKGDWKGLKKWQSELNGGKT